jgi:hypothetical protein
VYTWNTRRVQYSYVTFFALRLFVIKAERHGLVGEFTIDCCIGFSLSFHIRLVLVVKGDLHDAFAVKLESGSLSCNLSRVDDILKNGVVHRSQCTRTWARTGCLLVTCIGLAQKGTLGNNKDVAPVETVGDFYMAVCGLPDKRKDHAVVMARFARDCLQEVHQIVQKLEVSLGPGTG